MSQTAEQLKQAMAEAKAAWSAAEDKMSLTYRKELPQGGHVSLSYASSHLNVYGTTSRKIAVKLIEDGTPGQVVYCDGNTIKHVRLFFQEY
jgi:hypothetical protein